MVDNFEQVLEAAPMVAELLSAAPTLKVLTTSRIPLRLYGEHEYSVPPLTLPDPERSPSVESLTHYEAVRLFMERAQAAKADFSMTNRSRARWVWGIRAGRPMAPPRMKTHTLTSTKADASPSFIMV